MNDTDRIPKSDFIESLAGYDGRFGYPTFNDLKPILPSHYQHHKGDWSTWDPLNKVTVLIRWIDIQETIAWQEREVKQLAESQKRYAAEEKQRQAREEEQRIQRLAKQNEKQEDESTRRARADNIHAEQMEASRRKQEFESQRREDKTVDDACESVSEILRLIPALSKCLHRIPVSRRNEVDLEGLFVSINKLKQFN